MNERKTYLVLGFLSGVAICMALVLGFVVWSVVSGKSVMGAGSGSPVAVAPSPVAPSPVAPSAPASPVKDVVSEDHVRGDKNAKVTLIEYSDFECPYCQRHAPTMEQVLKDYPKGVRIVFRHYPLSFHQNAPKEAEASECVAELGGNDKFWKFHDLIFQRTQTGGTGFALTALGPLAKEVGVNQDAFQKCLDSGKYAARVAKDMQEGSAAGVEGTPATFVNGQLVSGAVPYAQFKALIDAALK